MSDVPFNKANFIEINILCCYKQKPTTIYHGLGQHMSHMSYEQDRSLD